jgi:hypothetical protein
MNCTERITTGRENPAHLVAKMLQRAVPEVQHLRGGERKGEQTAMDQELLGEEEWTQSCK